LEVRQVPAGERRRVRFVDGDQIDHAVATLDVDRADVGRRVHAETAALDHRRPRHADVRVLGGDHHVAAAEDRGVAGEAVAGVDPNQGDGAGEPGEQDEGQAVETGHPARVGVARSTAAALGEEHDRQAQPGGELGQASLLAEVADDLAAGQHGGVV